MPASDDGKSSSVCIMSIDVHGGCVQKEKAMELLAVKWGCMSDDEKAPYYEKAAEVKEAYTNRVRLHADIHCLRFQAGLPSTRIYLSEHYGQFTPTTSTRLKSRVELS